MPRPSDWDSTQFDKLIGPQSTEEAEAISEPLLDEEPRPLVANFPDHKPDYRADEPVVTYTETSGELFEDTDGNGRHELADVEENIFRQPKRKRRWLPKIGKPSRLFKRRKDKPEKSPKQRRQRDTANGKAIRVFTWIILIIVALGIIRAYVQPHKLAVEREQRKAADSKVEGQLRLLDSSSVFPVQDAVAKARRMAYECFTVPNAGVTTKETDEVVRQQSALTSAGIPVSDKVNCGWDGKGRGMVVDLQVVGDPYWIKSSRATVILQVKLYQRPGYFYIYVPFKKDNGKATVAGMPAIFGTASGAQDFLTECNDSSESVSIDPLTHTAQLFVNALANDSSVDLGYLVYGNAKFGGFGPTVSSPKVLDARYCGTRGDERLFAANIQFSGPVNGAHYILPYAFGVVPNPQTSGQYQIKHFGPAPGYTGF